MKQLLEAINRGILRGLRENNIELLTDLDDDTDQLDSLQTKSMNNKIDYSIKQQLISAIQSSNISNALKQLINDPINFSKLKGLIKANNKEHLIELIEIGQKLFGNDGNFNWIDTSGITDMSKLFFTNKDFNGHIELWDVSNVTDMNFMFCNAYKFNQPIGDWDVKNVTDMHHMFYNAYIFNQPIGEWNVGKVTNMEYMFYFAEKFNQPIGDWDVSTVTDMHSMFDQARKFNQPIGDWDVSSVINMSHMFYAAKSFNQPIGDWDVSNAVRFDQMFYAATQFKQNLSKWDLTDIFSTFANMFGGSAMEQCLEYLPNTIIKQYYKYE